MRTTNVVETPGAAKVATRITVETATGPTLNVEAVVERLLRVIFESEETAQIEPETEQQNKIVELRKLLRQILNWSS